MAGFLPPAARGAVRPQAIIYLTEGPVLVELRQVSRLEKTGRALPPRGSAPRLTLTRLSLPAELRHSLACANIIENAMGTVRRVCRSVRYRPLDVDDAAMQQATLA